MVRLSKRMEAVAAMVSPGVLADVGTDHGYVPIALVQANKIQHAIAMDINSGPLARAQENIRANHLEAYIETRLSDGVKALASGEADSILIAGMGGGLVIHILSEGKKICRECPELILQPQSDVRRVREYLRLCSYQITDEDMVCEDGKFYPIMRVVSVDCDSRRQQMDEEYTTICDMYGPLLLQSANPVLRLFLLRQQEQLKKVLVQLEGQPRSQAIAERIGQVKQELGYNELAYKILGVSKCRNLN